MIEQSSEELSVDSFLHHFWLSRYEYITAKRLYKAIKRQVSTPASATEFLDTLTREAKTYREIHEPSFGRRSKQEIGIVQSLCALNLFRVKQELPMVMSVMRQYEAKGLKLRQVLSMLAAIENFHFIFTAVTSQRSSGGISLMYALHARNLTAATTPEDKAKALGELIKKLRDRVPTFVEFEADFLEIRYSTKYAKQKKLVQYILAQIDRSMNHGGAPLDYEQMTIEHIAPENPQGGRAVVSDESVAQLGNLILVDQTLNNKLTNMSFPNKKKILCGPGCKVWVEDAIHSADDWGETEIENRTRQLAKIAFEKVWKV